jgi:DNA segregation ATPase FtsK/SpoIIIE, S-DNA-T family
VNLLTGYTAACPDAALTGVDLKGGLELKPWAPVFAPGWLATTLSETEKLLGRLVAVMEGRIEELAGSDRLWSSTSDKPAVVLVIDEQSLVKTSKDAIRLLEDLAIRGRALGITIIFATQYPTKESIGSAVLVEQITVTVGLRVRSPQSSRVLFGEHADRDGWTPHQIDKRAKGYLYLEAPGADTPRLARADYVSDTQVRRLVREYRDSRPTLEIPARPAPEPSRGEAHEEANPLAELAPIVPLRRDDGGETHVLAELLDQAGPEGVGVPELMERTGMSRPWVYKQLDRFGARQLDRGRWGPPL